ncbi:MAG: PilZ domain-containing protein [bacterium]|jgi:ribonucleotide reductase alpha subunit|nr:PilZ domain-containing protein [bacterium]
MNQPEKRRHSRLSKFLYVQYSYFTKYNYLTKIFEGIMQDIDQNGLRLSTKTYIPEKTKVSMLFSPSDARIRACGEVIWVRKAKKFFKINEHYSIGLKFTQTKDTDIEKITRL